MNQITSILTIILFFFINTILAQESEPEIEIQVDASKPTNLYTQVNTVFEYQSRKSGKDVYGTRINVQYTFNPDNLLLVEVPLLYNANTEKFGLSETRIRYFNVAKRNLKKPLLQLALLLTFQFLLVNLKMD